MMVTSNVPIQSYASRLLHHHLFSKKKEEFPLKSIRQTISTSGLKSEVPTLNRKKKRKLNSLWFTRMQKKKASLRLIQSKIL